MTSQLRSARLTRTAVPESVLGIDDRLPVRDVDRFPWSAICRLEAVFPSGASLTGTAALIGPSVALTAAHCVHDMRLGGLARRVSLTPGRGDHDRRGGSAEATRVHLPNQWQTRWQSDFDFALVHLNIPLGYSRGWFRLGRLRPASLRGALINLAGYPVDRPDTPVELKGRVQYWSLGTVLEARAGRLVHTADSYYGQSGAPLWLYSPTTRTRLLVAIHTSGGRDRNIGVALDRSRRALLRRWLRGAP